MRFKIDKEIGFHLIIIIIISLALWAGRAWPYETSLFPINVARLVLIVTFLSLFIYCFEKNKKGAPVKQETIEQGEVKKTLLNIGWLAGYVVATWLLGYVVASLLYVFLYTKLKGKQSWLVSILLTLGTFIFLQVIFVFLLDIRMLPGVLWEWLGI